MSRRDRLARVGTTLFGAEWQRPMARAMGAFVPGGPRDQIDDRLVRRWWNGDRPLPDWIDGALVKMLNVRAQEYLALALTIAQDAAVEATIQPS